MQDTTAGGAKKDTLTYALPPVMTIDMVEAVAAEMKQLPLPEKTHLILDASQLEAITTPGLQLIVALEKTIASQGGILTIQSAPESLVHALKDTGLEMLGASS